MIALIVLNYNDWETTSSFINSIRDYRSIGKIVVVDNCSSDNSYDKLNALCSERIDVIRTSENRGYAAGNNFGIRYAIEIYKPEYVIVSNPDVYFEEKTVDILREHAEKSEKTGIISSKMKCLSGIKLKVAWKQPTYWSYVISNFPILNRLTGGEPGYSDAELAAEVVEVDALPGSFFMMSVQAFQEIDGFDERTFLYCEESIVTARLHAKGYKNYLVTSEEYLHMHSVSINKSFSSVKRKLCIRHESREVYCKEYLGIGQFRLMVLRITFYFGLYEYLLLSKVRTMLRGR